MQRRSPFFRPSTSRRVTINTDIRVLKAAVCPSLSGKSRLCYELGADARAAVHVRITKNSGSGYFGKDWVPWDAVQTVLAKSNGKPVTFQTLLPLFKGQSINTAGFLLAVLKQEGLVRPTAGKARCHELGDLAPFLSHVKQLMEGGGGNSAKKPDGKAAATARGKKGTPRKPSP